MYLFEYEQKGLDRAKYGDGLYEEIAKRLKKKQFKGLGQRNLYLFRDLYLAYPQILQTLSAKLPDLNIPGILAFKKQPERDQSTFAYPTGHTDKIRVTDPELLLNRLSFSHFIELLKCNSALQRRFYETETIANNWSVRELRRAMDSLLFERTGLSADKEDVLKKHRSGSVLRAYPETSFETGRAGFWKQARQFFLA
jgi:hypothetical protein